MTEAEWLAATDPTPMLEFLRGKAGDRKLRLFAVACCQHISRLIRDPRSRKAVKSAERLAEGKCNEDDVWLDKECADLAFNDNEFGEGCEDAREAAFQVLESPAFDAALYTWSCAANAVYWQEDRDTRTEKEMELRRKAEESAQLGMLRDIFGNPFRPVTIDASWLTSTVLQLARGIYKSRDWSTLAILADALQDAGCDNADILKHCREPGEHVRGCWVLDLLMGRK